MDAAFYRQADSTKDSIIIQSVLLSKNNLKVLLACIVTCEDSEQITDRDYCDEIVDFFREKVLPQISVGRNISTDLLEKQIDVFWGKYLDASISVAGALIYGNEFIMFRHGRNKIYAIREFLGRADISEMYANKCGSHLCFLRGEIYFGVGIILVNACFDNALAAVNGAGDNNKAMKDCLYMKNYQGEKSLQKHLNELSCELEKHGGREMCVIMLMT